MITTSRIAVTTEDLLDWAIVAERPRNQAPPLLWTWHLADIPAFQRMRNAGRVVECQRHSDGKVEQLAKLAAPVVRRRR